METITIECTTQPNTTFSDALLEMSIFDNVRYQGSDFEGCHTFLVDVPAEYEELSFVEL